MSEYITIVVKFDKEQKLPTFRANQGCLGGVITGFMWGDALAEIEKQANPIEPESGLEYTKEFRDKYWGADNG